MKFSGHRGQYPREVSKFDFNFLVNTSFYKVFMQSHPRVNLLFIVQTVQPSQYVKSGYFFLTSCCGSVYCGIVVEAYVKFFYVY